MMSLKSFSWYVIETKIPCSDINICAELSVLLITFCFLVLGLYFNFCCFFENNFSLLLFFTGITSWGPRQNNLWKHLSGSDLENSCH